MLANPTTPTRHVPLPTFGDPTQHPLVDLSDKDALWEMLDSDGYR